MSQYWHFRPNGTFADSSNPYQEHEVALGRLQLRLVAYWLGCYFALFRNRHATKPRQDYLIDLGEATIGAEVLDPLGVTIENFRLAPSAQLC